MRTSTFDRLSQAEAQDLLTTGEAAAVLNSSRQHVVDLCDRGSLPFTTVGTHRRIRRSDIEAIRTRTDHLTRDQRRSLWLAYALAGVIAEDPERSTELARKNLDGMRAVSRGQTSRWLDEWARLLDGPTDRMLQALVSASPKGRELRQNNPFAGLLAADERTRVLDAWRRHDPSART